MFVDIIFNSVWVAEWPLLGIERLTRSTICSLYFDYSYFWLFPVFVLKAEFGF